jgi:hypothetical protein
MKALLVRYSYKNKPWNYLLVKTSTTLRQITNSTTEAFKAYKWRVLTGRQNWDGTNNGSNTLCGAG